MSCETTASSSRPIPRRPLPPSLHLVSPHDSLGCPPDSKDTAETSNRGFHRFFHARRFSTVERLHKVGEEVFEGEKAVRNVRPRNSLRRKRFDHPPPPRRPLHCTVSQTTASRMSAPQYSPTTLITSFPLLNVSDIPAKSPTNKSPFSAVLLAEEDGDGEEGEALWHTEQLHRARLAKLTRHLGEEIPAEMVLGPALLSRGTSRSSVYARRGGYHHRRKSLDPSALMQDSSDDTRVVQRSKSLKLQGDICPALSVTSEMPSTSKGKTIQMAPIVADPAQPPSPTPETHPPMDANGDFRDETASIYTRSASLLSNASRPSIETPSETCPSSHQVSGAQSLSRKPSRRPSKADATRRVEKLAAFFGVDEDDVSAVTLAQSTTQTLRSAAPTRAVGNLTAGIDVADPQVEVEVEISKPKARFWNSRGSTRIIHPEDVRDKLRAMKAS